MVPTFAIVLCSFLFPSFAAADEGSAEPPKASTEASALTPITVPPQDASGVSRAPQVMALTPVSLGADLVPFVGTSAAHRGKDLRALSINLIGYQGGVDGLDLSALGSLTLRDLDGVSLSGGGTIVGGNLDGVVASGGLVAVGGSADGIIASGGLNAVRNEFDGVLLTGGGNIVGGTAEGVQLAAGGNLVGGSGEVVQLSAGGNIVGGDLEGLQLAAGLNVVGGDVEGAQVSTFNLARGGVEGAQIGLLNISGGDVQGTQVGLVNIAENSDYSIGMFNFIRNGRTHIQLWQDAEGFTHSALLHGGRRLHNLYGVGVRATGPCPDWTVMLGIGGHEEGSRGRVHVDTDLMVEHLSPFQGFLAAVNERATFRASVGFKPAKGIKIFAGPSASLLWSSVQSGQRYDNGWTFAKGQSGEINLRGFTGWQVGVELL